jgi:hypothetical protein
MATLSKIMDVASASIAKVSSVARASIELVMGARVSLLV